MDLVFVVSTGRCGSSLLSRLLRGHPAVLTIDELFSFTPIQGRLEGRVDGRRFWHQLADPLPVVDALIRDGVPLPELVYPYETGRFNPSVGVPMISHIILPTLSDDPDLLYDRLAAEVPSWPVSAVPNHYRRLFDALATERGRSVVIERSGASIRFVAHLRRAFPEARFVYLSRDGTECALSMSKHAAFRFAVLAEVMQATGEPAVAAAPGAPMVDTQSAVQAPIPLSVFGSLWSSMTRKGAEEIAAMPPEIWTPLRYEHLLRDPRRALRGLAGFLGVTAPDSWLGWAADQVRSPAARPERLDPAEVHALRVACGPGYDADGMLYAISRTR